MISDLSVRSRDFLIETSDTFHICLPRLAIGSSFTDLIDPLCIIVFYLFFRRDKARSRPEFPPSLPLPELRAVFPLLCVFHLSCPPPAVPHLHPAGCQQRLLLRRTPSLYQHCVRSHILLNSKIHIHSKKSFLSDVDLHLLLLSPLSYSFPMQHFGKLSGLVMTLSSVVLFLQFPIQYVIQHQLQGDPLYVSVQRVCDTVISLTDSPSKVQNKWDLSLKDHSKMFTPSEI